MKTFTLNLKFQYGPHSQINDNYFAFGHYFYFLTIYHCFNILSLYIFILMLKYFKHTENNITTTHITTIHTFKMYKHFAPKFLLKRKKIFQTVWNILPYTISPPLSQAYLNNLKSRYSFSSLLLHVYFICIHKQ